MQQRWMFRGGALLVVVAVACGGRAYQQHAQRIAFEDAQVAAILAAKGQVYVTEPYSELFRSARASDLRRLKPNPNDSIAIQAAWEEATRSRPKAPNTQPWPDRDHMVRFFEFLEAREVQIPTWWSEAMLTPASLYGAVGRRPTVAPPRSAKFVTDNGQTAVKTERESVVVPADLPKMLGADKKYVRAVGPALMPDCPYEVGALITPACCYVAAHAGDSSYRLACVDRPAATLRWTAEVWGGIWPGMTGYADNRMWIEVTEQGDRVVVFGFSRCVVHIEAFRATDGSNIFRFSNSYSWW